MKMRNVNQMPSTCLFLMAFLLLTHTLMAQVNPLGLKAIRVEDLKADLYAHADAKFKGRSAGTLDELNAAAWLAEKYKAIGIKPAGDNGTYFQFFTLWRNHIADNSSIQLNDKPLALWNDVTIAQMANVNLNAPILYLGNALDMDTTMDVKGKIMAFEANAKGINLEISLPTWRYSRYIYTKYGLSLLKRGATAILIIADETGEKAWEDANENFKRGNGIYSDGVK